MGTLLVKAFNGRNLRTRNKRKVRYARPLCSAIDMDRAGTASADAAAEFSPRKPDLIADRPQERRVRISIDGDFLSV
jgi:hypothetical protein